MTKPFPSYVKYDDYKYILIRKTSDDGSPFDWVGIKPNSYSMAGNYSVTYQVEDNLFYVNEIGLMYGATREGLNNLPPINSVHSVGIYYRDTDTQTAWVVYKDVNILLQSTGYITVGGKIVEKYRSSRLPPCPRDFELVFRFTLSNGAVEKIEDLSNQVKVIRDKQTTLDNERNESYKADKYTSYDSFFASFKREEYKKLFAEERCIENPTNCDG